MNVEGWKSFFEQGGVVLLFLTFTFGAGAVLTGNRVNKQQAERLRTFDADLTFAKTELARQQERAAKAEAAISLAEEHASEASTKAEGFRLDIARSNEESARAQAQVATATAEAAKATEKAAEASKTAEQERLARVQLEAEIAPRRLNAEQEQAIAEACVPFRGQTVAVVSYAMDVEAAILAKQIIISLKAGGMNVVDSTASTMSMGGFAAGIHITGAPVATANVLRYVLSNVAHQVVAPANLPQPGMQEGSSLQVLVGVKPIK